MKLSFFSDFDATISINDVCDEMFYKFGNFDYHWQKFLDGEYNVRKLNQQLCGSIDKSIDLNILESFFMMQDIDVYFKKFVNFCHKNEYNLTIVSDGYDVYINSILNKFDIKNLPIYCNKLVKNENGFYPIFWGADESCNCTTASCKRNAILNNSSDEQILVYIGDGITDFCAAEHCDIIFAKSKLAAYCNANKIPHHNFKSFFDVIQIMETLIKEKKVKRRNQAFLKRKNAFEQE